MAASVSAHGKGQVADEGAASCSSSAGSDTSASSSSLPSAFALLDLPRDCMVRVMSALSAPDLCRMARVCSTLRALADSDDIWAARLPENPAISPPSVSRKDLFFRLCAGMLHKDLSQPYWLDPETCEGCFVESARDLTIVWGDDRRYWHWERQSDSWFAESALLNAVCWFEVHGKFDNMFLPGAYTVSFRIKFTDTLNGWAGEPVELALSTSNGQHVKAQRFFYGRRNQGVSNLAPLRPLKSCSWMELDIGEFVVQREMNVTVQFSMLEIKGGRWKHGVLLDCVKIQPSSAIAKS